MGVKKPYHRTVRAFTDGNYSKGGKGSYVRHPQYAQAPQAYVRAFEVLQRDFLKLLDFVEPADECGTTYSFQIHGLLMRVCIEVEANLKAIVYENEIARPGDDGLNMTLYRKLNASHHLSSYEVRLPIWRGKLGCRTPFSAWAGTGALEWYRAYNNSKHDREAEFYQANFHNLVDAFSGLVALLSAQFLSEDYSPHVGTIGFENGDIRSDFESAIGGYFLVKYPSDWTPDELYDFDLKAFWSDPSPFDKLRLT